MPILIRQQTRIVDQYISSVIKIKIGCGCFTSNRQKTELEPTFLKGNWNHRLEEIYILNIFQKTCFLCMAGCHKRKKAVYFLVQVTRRVDYIPVNFFGRTFGAPNFTANLISLLFI